MTLFPFYEDIEGKTFLVVGAGKVAAHKVEKLLPFTEQIRVVAPVVESAMWDRVADTGVTVEKRSFRVEDLDGVDFCIAATADAVLNTSIAELCAPRGIRVNVVNAPEKCTFVFPSYVKRGDLVVGIATAGKSPVMSSYVRKELEQMLPENTGDILDRMGTVRAQLNAKVTGQTARSAVLNNVLAALLECNNNMSDEELSALVNQCVYEEK